MSNKKSRVSFQVEFDAETLKSLELNASTKILGGRLVAFDLDGLAFERSYLLDEALELLGSVEGLRDWPEDFDRLVNDIEKLKEKVERLNETN